MHVDIGVAEYNIEIGPSLIGPLIRELEEDPDNNLIVIDKAVASHLKKIYDNINGLNVIELTAGKESKTFYALTNIFSTMEKLNIPRSGKIIAIGGGVIGDVAGLAASLWYRGCDLVHVPTTLIASVDSCLGGKTAINFNTTINAIGNYHHPSKIIIDTDLIKNLPDRELKSGLGEVIKYSVLGNSEITKMLNSLKYDEIIKLNNLKKLIELCLKQKAEFVTGDIREQNKRLLLNLGHTIGHALEVNSIVDGNEQLRHGEGVALGIIAISKVAVEVGYLDTQDLEKISALVNKFGLPTLVSPELFACNRDLLIEKCVVSAFKDKKRTTSGLRLILPTSSSGECKIFPTDSKDLLQKGIEFVIENSQ
jgi:3-dehydroquinate synthetase|tara:strand:+ start:8976 stop:10073 length:1098 start_codon:yes stop_codon:yes gene_type:complete